MKRIKLTQGKYALVDDEDYILLSDRKWSACYRPQNDTYYASRRKTVNGVRINEIMARVIMGAKDGELVDHINHNTLDNRRKNLRIATKQQNNRNRSINRNNTTGVKGVYLWKKNGKYVANIRVNNKNKTLGYYDTIKEAARAYNKAARKYFGEFAYPSKRISL